MQYFDSSPSSLRIGVIAGDGIGSELTTSATEVMRAALTAHATSVEFVAEDAGADTHRRTGASMTNGALDRIRGYDALLKGPVGLPSVRHSDGTEAGLLGGVLRTGLDTYANLRPVNLLPGVTTPTRYQPGEIDYVIVRENTEGLYISRGIGVRNERAACDQLMVTREGVERVVRRAFEAAGQRSGAPADGVHRVTCVDKSNVLRSMAFFRDVFTTVAAEYPGIEADYCYVDAAAHELVANPGRFDVLVMENLMGDILSDLGAATVGGLGMCPSANVGDTTAYFEPIHGSAPDIAGTGRANPTSQILSGALLLEHVGHHAAARTLREAVAAAYANTTIVLDSTGSPQGGTQSVTDAVATAITG